MTAASHSVQFPATFVMPLFCDSPRSIEYASAAVQSLVDQTDPDWRLIVIDDCSPVPPSQLAADLENLKAIDARRIVIVRQPTNNRQGVCRNVGIEMAQRAGSPMVLFLDADDLAHPRRLEVTRRIFDTTTADFVYSPFDVIDEESRPFERGDLTPSIAEILDELEANPVEGYDCWIPIAIRTGYLTLTSTVSVRTAVAVAHPFPRSPGSEDFHTFLRMSAGGAVFSYQSEIPAQYRVNRTTGSADRSRWGREEYYATKLAADIDAFEQAGKLALARGVVTASETDDLREQFRARLAETIRGEGFGHLLDPQPSF